MTPIALVTGFGAFPGAARNPSATLIDGTPWPVVAGRLGLEIVTAVLPVSYAGLPRRHAELIRLHQPMVALHFGLAGRTRTVRVERFAANYESPIRPDAEGQGGHGPIEPKGPPRRQCPWPADEIATVLNRAGVPASVSHDAGDYLCNLLLWRALGTPAGTAGRAGFIHLPTAARLARITGRSERDALNCLAEPILRVMARGL